MKGENNQDLGRTLPLNEGRMTEQEFRKFLDDSARYDPENFQTKNIVFEDGEDTQVWAVVIGEHSIKRLSQRTFMIREELMDKVLAVLKCPGVGKTVRDHQICWDDENQKTVDLNDDGIKVTTVKIEGADLVFVFECGFTYIRLVTMWSGDPEKFITHESADITINKEEVIKHSKP